MKGGLFVVGWKDLLLGFGQLLVEEGVHAIQLLVGKLLVDQNPAAVLVHDDALALSDVNLALRRNLDEGTRAGLTLDGHHSQAVLGSAPDAAVAVDETVFDANWSSTGSRLMTMSSTPGF